MSVTFDDIKLADIFNNIRDSSRLLKSQLEDIQFCARDQDIAKNYIRSVNSSNSWLCEETPFDLSLLENIMLKVGKSLQDALRYEEEIRELREKYVQKCRFLSELFEMGFDYTSQSNLTSYVEENEGHLLCVSFSSEYDVNEIMNNIHFLVDLRERFNLSLRLLAIDMDLATAKGFKNSLISHYVNDKCISKNVRSHGIKTNENLVSSVSTITTAQKELMTDRALFKVSCPQCKDALVTWKCADCGSLLEYCCNGIAVCSCGWLTPGALTFRCGNYFHDTFVRHDNLEVLHQELSQLRPSKQYTILLVGQSGAGKSTWINGLVNYLKYDSFDKAADGEIMSLVPMQFSICDSEGNPYQVCLKGDGLENLTIGASATQMSRSYIIYHGDERIAIIDTPGLGDTRGYEQDMTNIKGIITHLKNAPNIHAICFVLLPNETRLNVLFRFVLQEVFISLHRNVTRNLFFLFTNARSTNYRPGSSLQLISEILKNFRTKYELTPDCVYCFDNEAFKFLVSLKQTALQFTEEERKTYKESWSITSKEVQRLIRNIRNLQPYNSECSIELYKANSCLLLLVSQALEAKKLQSVANLDEAVKLSTEKIERLKKDLYKDARVVKTVPSQSRLVCAASKCVQVADGQKIYSQTCEASCPIALSLHQTRALAQLKLRPVLSSGTCTVCRCIWEDHMVITYVQSVSDKKVKDGKISDEINRCELDIAMWKSLKKDQLNESLKVNVDSRIQRIVDYVGKYAVLLFNDATEEYISYLINSENVRPGKTDEDWKRLDRLKGLREIMLDLKQIMEKYTVHHVLTNDACKPFDLERGTFNLTDEVFGKGTNSVLEL